MSDLPGKCQEYSVASVVLSRVGYREDVPLLVYVPVLFQ